MGLPPGDPLGKRGRPAYDDGEDDEEPVYIKKEAGLKKEANASTEKQAKATAEKEINASTKRVKIELHVTTDKSTAASSSPTSQVVILNWRTTDGRQHQWPVDESILARVGMYTPKLANAQMQRVCPDKLLEITDTIAHKWDKLLLLIKYLTIGTLPTIDPWSVDGLARAWSLCVFAATLRVPHLVSAVQQRIAAVMTYTTFADFVAFAERCSAAGQDIRVTAGDGIGVSFKGYIKSNLKHLDRYGYLEQIKAKDGLLKDLLLEVLVEVYREL